MQLTRTMGHSSDFWKVLALPVYAFALCSLVACGRAANDPPSDDEAFSAFMVYWSEHAAKDGVAELLTPISVRQMDNAVTSDSAFGRERAVTGIYTFQARTNLNYECTGFQDVVEASTEPGRHPYAANAGDAIACKIKTKFDKIEEGWQMHFLGWDTESYIIRR